MEHFLKIKKAYIYDIDLTMELLGTLIYLEYKLPLGNVRTSDLVDRFNLNQETVQKRINKLIELGYVKRTQPKIKGKFGPGKLELVADCPRLKEVNS